MDKRNFLEVGRYDTSTFHFFHVLWDTLICTHTYLHICMHTYMDTFIHRHTHTVHDSENLASSLIIWNLPIKLPCDTVCTVITTTRLPTWTLLGIAKRTTTSEFYTPTNHVKIRNM